MYRFYLLLKNLVVKAYFAIKNNCSRYNFSVQVLTVAIEIFTVNLPSGAPNVTERASQKTGNSLTVSKRTERHNMRDSDGTENSPIQPIAGRKEQKQDGHHC